MKRSGGAEGVTWLGGDVGGRQGAATAEAPWEEVEPYDAEACAVGESLEWQELAGPGTEPPVEHDPRVVLADPAGALRRVLTDLGLGTGTVEAVTGAAQVAAVHEGSLDAPGADLDAVAGVGTLASVRCRMEAVQLVAVADLVLRTGRRLLEEKGVDDPAGLSTTAWARWRARVKSLVAADLEVALGVGRGEGRDMVAVACAPRGIGTPVLEALRRGEVPWHLVRRFWTKAGSLPVEDVTTIARALFGTDAEDAAPERLDPDGALHGRAWAVKEFYAALDREVVRAQGKDERSARRARDEAVATRDAWLRVHDDGTATLGMRTSLITGVAVFARVDRMARTLRGGGEERSLAQLRSDLCATLLLHGTVAVPEVVDDLVSPEDVQTLAAVTTASPPVALQVVVPWDALAGGVVCPRCAHTVHGPDDGTEDGDGTPGTTFQRFTRTERPWPPVPDWLARRCGHERARSSPPREPEGPPSPGAPHTPFTPDASGPPPGRWPVVGRSPLPGLAWSGTVAELLGLHPAFLTPGQARELALAPGTTMYRILADPADGRCIERTIATYRPDAEMRRQIAAADVYGRGPGERTPPARWQIDHEHEHQDGGPTAETNLNGKGVFFHAVKTARLWSSVMNERRDLTWTTLLGQVVTTRGHDYRQYLSRLDVLTPDPREHQRDRTVQSERETCDDDHGGDLDGSHGSDHDVVGEDRPTMADRADLANRLLYAAIAHRHAGAPARASDDIVDAEAYDLRLAGWASIDPRPALSRDGRHADLRGPTPEQLLGLVTPAQGSRGQGPTRGPAQGPTQGPAQGWATRTGPHDRPPF